jgi:hypothetical protein
MIRKADRSLVLSLPSSQLIHQRTQPSTSGVGSRSPPLGRLAFGAPSTAFHAGRMDVWMLEKGILSFGDVMGFVLVASVDQPRGSCGDA